MPRQFPKDLAALLALYWLLIPIASFGAWVFPAAINARKTGDTSLLWVALACGLVGSVLLFLARLPHYRQRRWFQIGPRGLDRRHRRLYKWAWVFLGVSIGMLGVLVIVTRDSSMM